MKPLALIFSSSLGRKYLMALSGIVLVLFVLGHMAGNLLFFAGPEALNRYAYQLHSMPELLWVARIGLLVAVIVHIWAATMLTLENRRARPAHYAVKVNKDASFASRTMRWTGYILLVFIIFHLLHYTTMTVDSSYRDLTTTLPGVEGPVHDVYTMLVKGFEVWWLSAFYVFSVGLLCLHLAHGVSSLFQSLGLRNERWRYGLNKFALVYGWVIFLGFASIPVAVMLGVGSGS